MNQADVVIIGGGVMGLFAALHLAETDAGRIVLLEQRHLGAGSSGKSGAILRQHYSHEVTIRMARASLLDYRTFEARHGLDIGFTETGMIFTCHARDRTTLEANVARQRELGVDVVVLDAPALRALDPHATFGDDVIGAFEREAGYVSPVATLKALAALGRDRGVVIREGTQVEDVLVEEGRVQAVALAGGERLATPIVLNAGGPWAGILCKRLGLDLPLRAIRPEQAYFAAPNGRERFVYGDLLTGLYWKPEPAGWMRVGKMAYDGDAEVPDPDAYDEGVSNRFIDQCRTRLTQRRPDYARAVSWGGCSALYTVTPDAHPMIGPVPGIDGLHLVSGFSGHGFKLGPAVGRGVAAMLTGGDPSPLDPAFFAVDRFARGRPIESAYEYGILG
ncbi:MAG: FAD-binding oxidoreductase [Phycisphaerales bacterium]|nr:FAD-binding oxidoreductase [Phycisphaerae bacterium]NNF43201.1 FAD-binding oxidoreductase [Phycisphaerales bacterium]NNM26854.1 FAD-binding oxidoreductase [Phycisphaerales bacterium]